MAIRVAPDAMRLLSDYAEGFVVQVTGASDVDGAVEALARARVDIVALAPPTTDPERTPVASNPVIGPRGPLLRIARLEVSDEVLHTVPDLIAAELEAAGVETAVIEVPEPGGPLDRLDSCHNAVVLRLFPDPKGPRTLPPAWLDVACEWALGDLGSNDRVPIRLLALEFEVKVADAPAIVHQASQAQAWCDLVNGDLEERVRTASITFGRAPHLALAAGGPACDSQALLARFELLCEVARELAPDVGYACVDVEPTFEGIGLGLSSTGWRDRGGASPNLVAASFGDVLVPDAYPFQILGRGHLARIDPAADTDDPPFGEPLGEGTWEVQVGEPQDWLPIYDARHEVQERGWELLADLLATDEQVAALQAEAGADLDPDDLVAPATEDDRQPTPGPAGVPGVPDLDDITLETLPHTRRGLRLTLLELVSWLAHEPHSDAPVTASPVVATYARWFASALSDKRRQTLKSRARRLIGTAELTTNGRGLAPRDVERAWIATDWLVRVQAASWLRLAGLVEAAGRLESIGPTSNHLDLVRAVDVLGSAITIAGRRIDLTTSIAGAERADDAFLLDQAAWDAWELASETSGWVAASEAAAFGVPAELAYATDLRVIECARDAKVRDELEAGRRSIGDSAWATALHAVADEAWTAGWFAAHRAVDASAVVPLKTAIDRATRAVVARDDVDDDLVESSLEAAEAAAKEVLTRAALDGDRGAEPSVHPWDSALAAATTAPDSQTWASIQALSRAAVDEGPWAQGMQAARAAVDAVLQGAPDLVARSVGAAVAREAAGVAARGVALRAAAVARAQGATAGEAADAAEAALADTVADLQDAAFALLDVLINVSGTESKPTIRADRAADSA